MSKTAHKKLKIDVVDELHAIRQRLVKVSQDEILKEVETMRKKIVKPKKKR